MNHSKYFFKTLIIFALFTIAILLGSSFASQYFLSDNPLLVADSRPANPVYANPICGAFAQGDFEQARQYLKEYAADETVEGAEPLAGVMDGYDKLIAKLDESRQEAYQEHLDELNKKVDLARHPEKITEEENKEEELTTDNAATEEVVVEKDVPEEIITDEASGEKDAPELTLEEKVQASWLSALAQLVSCHQLADRMHLESKVPDDLKNEIIEQCMAIAKSLEDEDKGLDAYSKVYGLLAVLDEKKYNYDDMYDRLLRIAVDEALYAPDPNKDGVTWKERRKNIDYDMIFTALATIKVGYVDEPNFQEMARRGLRNCLYLLEAEKIDESFPSLKDETKVELYKNSVDALFEQVNDVTQDQFTLSVLMRVMEGMQKINNQSLEFPEEVLLAEMAEGMFNALDDYTYIVWPADVEDFSKEMRSEFSGIGVVINKSKDNVLQADSLVSFDAPAYKAGINAGDQIIEIDGKETSNLTLEKAVHLITGPRGTDVNLTIRREGYDEPLEFTVTRQQVVVPTVKGIYREADGQWQRFLDEENQIGYLRLTHFAEETAPRLRRYLDEMKEQGMKAFILDLRSNSGGYLSSAVDIVNMFVTEGTIVSSRYRAEKHEEVKTARRRGTFDADMPMVVLINSASASASEIVSGALKDHHRATIIGTRSFGKGNVQTIQPLGDSMAQMKMTIAYYYLPSGRRVHRNPKDKGNKDYGVEPNLTVELTGKQIVDFITSQHDAGVLYRNDIPEDKRNWDVFTLDKVLESDLQLQMAILNLKGQVLARENPLDLPTSMTVLAR